MTRLFALVFLLAALCCGQSLYPENSLRSWQYGLTYIPLTNTVITLPAKPGNGSVTAVYVDVVFLSNVSASVVTVTITDRSTNCNGAPCQIFPAVTIQPNQVYAANLLGVTAQGGLKWSASAATSVQGWIKGKF